MTSSYVHPNFPRHWSDAVAPTTRSTLPVSSGHGNQWKGINYSAIRNEFIVFVRKDNGTEGWRVIATAHSLDAAVAIRDAYLQKRKARQLRIEIEGTAA